MTDDRRPTDDGRPTDNRPPASFTMRLPRGDRSPLIPFAALGILVAIAVATSRPAVSGASDRPAAGPGIAVAIGPGASALARTSSGQSPSSSPSAAEAAVGAICLEPGSWRTATIETWRDQTVRVWRAIDPTPASGPDDPGIPIVPAVGSRVPAIGFCAPIVGPDRPTGTATIDAWWREPAIDRARPASAAVPIELNALVPAGSPSPFGALFAPSAGFAPSAPGSATTGWPPGVVVFRYTEIADGQARSSTWFGIEIVETDASGQEPSGARPAALGGPPLRP
jgi:hypothetical protein